MSMQQQVNARLTKSPPTQQVGKYVEDSNFFAIMRRRPWERRWYNNNWFDDGYHFRILSKRTGQILDHLNNYGGFIERAIPRASKQIRGIGSLLLTPDYYPVVYPRRVTQEDFRDKKTNQVNQQAYQMEMEKAKENARKQGIFLTTTWEDDLQLNLKIIDMVLLTMKNGISWMKVYTDPKTKHIASSIHDAFDVICYGDEREVDDLPFMTLAQPWDFNEVLSSPIFDEEMLMQLTPDNKYATSEIKEAYMRSRYGTKLNAIGLNTIVVRETFMKEYLSDENWDRCKELSKETGAMEHKSKGDIIMRHPWSAGGVTLLDEYIDYDTYPFAEFRMESGYLYQVPTIERFIPLNKTQDIVVTRIEKWINTMVTGIYQMRKGENMQIANLPTAQVVQFETQPLEQMQVTSVGATPFQFMQMTDKYLEEQGISSTNVQDLPGNIANNTLENIMQKEYSNMRFASERLKATVTRIGNLIMERADKDYIHPVEVNYKEDKEYKAFDVIGSRGKKVHSLVGKQLPDDLVVLDRKAKIRVEVDMGFGLTVDGRKQAMQTLITEMVNLYKLQFLSPQAMAMMVKRFVEEYGYGSTEEFMEAIEEGVTQGQMQQTQLDQMKLAMLQVLKDTKAVGADHDKNLVETTKLGTLQTLKDAGLLQQEEQAGKPEDAAKNLVAMYKMAPTDVRREIEKLMGLTPSQEEPVSREQSETAKNLHEIVKGTHEMNQPQETGQPSGNGVT